MKINDKESKELKHIDYILGEMIDKHSERFSDRYKYDLDRLEVCCWEAGQTLATLPLWDETARDSAIQDLIKASDYENMCIYGGMDKYFIESLTEDLSLNYMYRSEEDGVPEGWRIGTSYISFILKTHAEEYVKFLKETCEFRDGGWYLRGD